MSERLNYMQQSPELLGAYLNFSMAVGQSAIDADLRELVNLRVSQINGCAFCLDMHVKQAKIRGESELRLHHVAIWRESALFSPRERAAFEWAELLTHLPADGVDDAAYAAARQNFSEKELADLTFAIMLINGWNRANVAFRVPPGVHDAAFGLDKARFA